MKKNCMKLDYTIHSIFTQLFYSNTWRHKTTERVVDKGTIWSKFCTNYKCLEKSKKKKINAMCVNLQNQILRNGVWFQIELQGIKFKSSYVRGNVETEPCLLVGHGKCDSKTTINNLLINLLCNKIFFCNCDKNKPINYANCKVLIY